MLSRANLVILAAFAVLSALLVLPGRLAINGHEVDAIHAVTAALRVAGGELQHIDFLTPLGVLAFEPAALFLRMGAGAGMAFLLAHVLVAAVFLPMILHVATSRLSGLTAGLFGVGTLIMVMALVYGGDQATLSISMYYNRWAWALLFMVVLLMLLPGETPRRDGLVIGVCLSLLALSKATYFLVLAPVVAVWLLTGRDMARAVPIALVGVVAVGLATLVFGGVNFWIAYVHDLQFVAGSDVRPAPGQALGDLVAAPANLVGTLCLVAGVMGLRMAGLMREGMLFLLLVPGLIYVTYQNWGNDPKGLFLLAVLALSWRGQVGEGPVFGLPAKRFFDGLAVACLCLIAPSFINMGTSHFRNLAMDMDDFVVIAADPRHDDLLIERERSFTGEALVTLAGTGETEPEEPVMLGGVDLGGCTQKSGYFGKMSRIAADLEALGLADQTIALADVNNPLPLIGTIRSVPEESPWFYGGAAAALAADIVVVPKCPISKVTFTAYIAAMNGTGVDWIAGEESTHFRVFRRAE